MSGSGQSTSIGSSFSSLLQKVWNEWDVRGMMLFSLLLQITLSLLGKRRKYTSNPFTKTILWLAYLSADWVAIATLGKLSSSCAESSSINVLRAFWAPLLILHLGGPDTITAYAFEDNNLWARHLLILVVKAILAAYVILLSWTPFWLSLLTLPLMIAGITKYVERILCLKLNNSQKTKPILSINHPVPNEENQPAIYHFLKENDDVFNAYLLFSIMRPDVNNYPSRSLSTAIRRLDIYVEETTGLEHLRDCLSQLFESSSTLFDMLSAELGFIFDVVYTKSALIYTKTGCFLRLTSFVCSFSVLLLFLTSFKNESKFQFSRVDVCVTAIMLSGAIGLEIYAAWAMLSSDWATIVVAFHHNVLVRKIFWVFLKCLPGYLNRKMNRRKRRLDCVGQFDLLKYCWHYKKKEANKLWGFLQEITIGCGLIEMWHRYIFTEFVKVPSCLKETNTFIYLFNSFSTTDGNFEPSRGKRALQEHQQYDHLKWSIELEFEYSIIVWHLATSVCYHDDPQDPKDEAMETSKCVSDYMMYMLVTNPALLLLDQSKSFWLDHTYEKLKEFLSPSENPKEASESILNLDIDHEENTRPRDESPRDWTAMILLEEVQKLASSLKQSEGKWEMIKTVWIEMLLYSALSSSHISHLKQLGEGAEFLSVFWLLGDLSIFDTYVFHRAL